MKFRPHKIGWRSLIMASVLPLIILAAAALRVPAQTIAVSGALPNQQGKDVSRTSTIERPLQLKHRDVFRFQDQFAATRNSRMPNVQFFVPFSTTLKRNLPGTRRSQPSAFDPFNSSAGYVSLSNPWSTADSAFFPNGITTAGSVNWIYGGTTFIGNAPSNGFGHQFNAVNGASHAYLAIGGGNVGIGTTNPSYKLDVNGSVNAAGSFQSLNAASTTIGFRDGDETYRAHSFWVGNTNANGGMFAGITNYPGANTAVVNDGIFLVPAYVNNWNQWVPTLSIRGTSANGAGNVGIGITAPSVALEVAQNKAIRLGNANLSSGGDYVHLSNHTWYNGSAWQFDGSAGGLYQIAGQSHTWYKHDGSNFTALMTINPSGNVGIGTNSPGQKLSVAGTVESTSGGFKFPDGTVQTTAASGGGGSSQWTTSGTNIYYNSGNVGIGTNNPSGKLHVSGNTGSYTGIFLDDTASGGRQYGIESTDSANGIGAGKFAIFDGTAGVQRLTIDSSGNVGIGTTSPASNLQIGTQTSGATPTPATLSLGGSFSNSAGSNLKLKLYDDGVVSNTYGIGVSSASMDFGVHPSAGYHWYAGSVNKMTLSNDGNLTVSGNISAKYQDVAEWVPSSEQFSAGTVVVLDSTKSNQVTSSTTSYDTRVAGVVSEQPGIALGEKSERKVLVATTGRVRVTVDASKGAINIGDLLVTSDVPGMAMKSEPVNLGGVQIHRPGTLIGKALEPLAKGSGTILVLLSLQ